MHLHRGQKNVILFPPLKIFNYIFKLYLLSLSSNIQTCFRKYNQQPDTLPKNFLSACKRLLFRLDGKIQNNDSSNNISPIIRAVLI